MAIVEVVVVMVLIVYWKNIKKNVDDNGGDYDRGDYNSDFWWLDGSYWWLCIKRV